jgi:DNA-binding GntR family transcriptional regulator
VESRLPGGPVALNDEWQALHRDFHAALLAACPSRRQLAWCASLFDQAERYRRISAHQRTLRHKSDEHRQLMEVVLQRDADAASTLLTRHIRGTQGNVEAAFDAAKPA